MLKWAKENFTALKQCPINVSKSEIVALVGNTEEADAIIQMSKGRISESYIIQRMTFFTQDKGAINMMNRHYYEVLDYNDFRKKLFELRIILP